MNGLQNDLSERPIEPTVKQLIDALQNSIDERLNDAKRKIDNEVKEHAATKLKLSDALEKLKKNEERNHQQEKEMIDQREKLQRQESEIRDQREKLVKQGDQIAEQKELMNEQMKQLNSMQEEMKRLERNSGCRSVCTLLGSVTVMVIIIGMMK